MASTSSNNPSPVSNNNVSRYDVFLSFQGETRFTFTDQLYKALQDAGLIPFRDNDEIERGEDLQPEIERGIRESRASIVVLSKHYATSRWCLDELCLILDQATKRRHFVLPIFYHVDPAHVRKQEESFEIKVKSNTKWTEDNVERWKAALTKVGNMAGEVPSGPETKFSEKVVGIIEKRLDLKKVYHKANLVGMDTWRKEIDNWLEKSSAQILAVWGMGGIGKTTLARHTVYSNWENFGSISILEDIGSKSTEQLHELQQKLLSDILQGKKRKIPSVWQGTCKIENALQTEKALIVLDNIVEPSQLFVLLGTGIETQCKIIITTRESNPHKWFNQSTSWKCQELEMKSLDMNDSLELLSLHAFGSKAPTEGYDHLVEKALWYCEGNPLALEVLGSSLSPNNKQLWESRFNAFEKELDARIHIVLKGSYEALPLDSHRDLFLHIACFFVGKDIDYVVKILEPDYSALSGIETLFKSCLLSVSPNKKLMMHRMLQEMARTIVYKESPKNPAKRSRVWRYKESYDILQEGKGSKKIEGLALDIKLLNEGKESYEYESSDLTTESFKKMDKLKLLQLNSVDLTGSYENFSKQLRWLCWTGFSLRAIPSELYMKNLVAIDMSYSCLQDFEPPVDLHSLKILNLRSSKKLREIRNIHRLHYLEILILWDCISLTHVNLGGLTYLALLNITGCIKLCTGEEISQEGLFQKIKGKLSQKGSSIKSTQKASFLLPQSLERLFSSSCNLSDTDYFPLTFKDQPLLIYLNLVNGLFEFLPSYDHLKRLRVLDVSGCNDLTELRCLPTTLAELYIYYCNSLNIVTFESRGFILQEFGYEGCVNLCEVEGLFKLIPVTKLGESDLKHMTWLRQYQNLEVCLVGDVGLTKGRSSCVQMLYEFNIMSTSLPNIMKSNMMTDTDYMYTSQSTLLSFKVPACPEHRSLEGLIISFQYTAHCEDWVWFAKISTLSGVNLMYNPRVFGKPDEVGMWSSYWPIGKALQIEETVTVSIVVIKGHLDIHWCGASLVYTDEGANEALQENNECVAILGEDFSEFQLSTGDYYLCRRDFFELMEAGKLTPDWFRILVDEKIDYTEIGGWRMTGKPEHPYQSYTEVKTIRCIMYGPEMAEIYKIAELSKSSLLDKTMESTSDLSKAIPMDMVINETMASTSSLLLDKIESSEADLRRLSLQTEDSSIKRVEVEQEAEETHDIREPQSVEKRTEGVVEQPMDVESTDMVASTSNVSSNVKTEKSDLDELLKEMHDMKIEEGESENKEIEATDKGYGTIKDQIIVTSVGGKNGQPKQTLSYKAERVVGTGSFAVVFEAKCLQTGESVAIKKVLQDKRYKNRELQIMRLVDHPNVVPLKNCFFSTTEKNELYLNFVLEYIPETVYQVSKHYNRRKQHMPLIYVQLYTYQICRALNYIHSVIGVCHRDIKPQNLLVNPHTHQLKLCDFGAAKMLVPGEANISYICSRYYRAPELIFGATEYTYAIDMWSAGCVMAELILGQPLFPGENSVDQLVEIIKILGTPTIEEIKCMNPHYTDFRIPQIKAHPWHKIFQKRMPPEAIDLLSHLLKYSPKLRCSGLEACAHPFFDDLRKPNATLPNGKPLPDLFNFTPQELHHASPELLQRLVPKHLKIQIVKKSF